MSITSEQSPPSSSMEQVSKVVVDQQREQQIPVWIEEFLKAKFFVSCATHPYIGNHLNKYCITCRMSVCHYCITSGNRHSNHDTFQVYGHKYSDAVLLSDFKKHFNCSKILPLKNKQSMVIALKPLPHLSGLSRYTCRTCERRVSYRYSYCCLHCKVAAMSSKPSSASASAPPCNGDQTSSPNNKENKMRVDESGSSSLHKRKGKPFRAPFF